MHNNNKLGRGRPKSSTSAPGPRAPGAPAALDGHHDIKDAGARQRCLDEISAQLALLSFEIKQMLRTHSEIGAPQEQAVLHLVHLLEREMAKLLAIAQSGPAGKSK
jgi:hypothetical protein